MKKENSELPFTHPNIFETNMEAPSSIKKLVLAQIMPDYFIRPILISFLLLFLSPFLLLFLSLDLFLDKQILEFLILWECFLFVLFASTLGVIFITFKTPKFQEIKDKLGYIE
ncbi:MAG: hypothetical protein SFU98_09125 [Leptospiraceae bacterium]|nr:hypothetical protein [Leptospiraceae bacterium]